MLQWSPVLALGMLLAGCGGPQPSGAVVLLPSSPRTSDVVEAVVIASDPDGGTLVYSFAWTVEGTPVAHEGPSLDGDQFFDRDQEVAVTVTVRASDGDEATLRSNPVTVVNTPPRAPVVRVQAPQAQLDGDLTCVLDAPATDEDGDPIGYSATWTVDGTAYSGAGDDAFSGDTVGAVTTLEGETWRCTVVADDGTDPSDPAVAVVGLAPVIPAVAVSPDPLLTGDVASAVATVDPPPGGSFTHSWTVGGLAAGADPTLDGATAFDRGDAVAVTLTIHDGWGHTVDVSSPPVTVENTPPPTPGVTLSPGVVRQLDGDLVCEVDVPATDADGDPVDVWIWWDVDGTAYTDALTTTLPGDTVPADDTVLGTTWTCIAMADDGFALSAEASVSRELAPCSCDLVGAAAALDDLDPRAAGVLFEDCLRCEPDNAEALFGASFTSLLTFTEWQPVQDLLAMCGQNVDFAGDVYGVDGFLYAFDALADGQADVVLSHAFDTERPTDLGFATDPILVSAVLDGDELVITLADPLRQDVAGVGFTYNPADYLETLGLGDAIEIVLNTADVYGDDKTALADGVEVVLELAPKDTITVSLGCGQPGSSCAGQYKNSDVRGWIRFDTWDGAVDGMVEAEIDAQVGAFCAADPCTARHFVAGTVSDTISAPLTYPDIPFGDLPKPQFDYRPRSAELYDVHCDIPSWGAFNVLHAAMAEQLALDAARLAAAGNDASLSLEVPTTRLVASCDEAMWFNQADASTLAAAEHAAETAFALLSQYNVHEPTGEPIDSVADYNGEIAVCDAGGCTCDVVPLKGRSAPDRLADLDATFLTASPMFDYSTVEAGAIEAFAQSSEALDALPAGDGWLNFGGYGGMQSLRDDVVADLDALQASRSAPVPLPSAPAFVATVGEFLDAERTRSDVLAELGVSSLLEIAPGTCEEDRVLGPTKDLAAWLENEGAGAMVIPLNDPTPFCSVDADCAAGFTCLSAVCQPTWPAALDVDRLTSAIGGDRFPVFANRDQVDAVTCPFGGWDGVELGAGSQSEPAR